MKKRSSPMLLPIFMILMTFQSCQSQPSARDKVPYHLKQPTKVFELPQELVEVSALTWWGDHTLASVQDEQGIVFFISAETGKVIRELEFGEKGDYEGIAKVGEELYVQRSDGNLFKIEKTDVVKTQGKELKTKFTVDNNTEGLCYNPKTNKLWMACKAEPMLHSDKKDTGKRAVYFFDPVEETLNKEPGILLDEKQVVSFAQHKYGDRLGKEFRPSAISIHPISGDVYILSAIGKMLLVLHPDFNIKDVIRLVPKYAVQAEGIAFDPQGGLYISNEGDKGKALLLYYKMDEN